MPTLAFSHRRLSGQRQSSSAKLGWESGLGQPGSVAIAPEFSLSRRLAATHSAQPFLHQVDPEILFPPLLHYADDTPYIPVNSDENLLPFLLDTGAAVSVLPKRKLLLYYRNR